MKQIARIFVCVAVSMATSVQAQEFKFQEGDTLPELDRAFSAPLDPAFALGFTERPTFETATLPNSDLTLDSGYFETPPVAAPGAFDRSFTGLRFRLPVEEQ